MEQEIKDLTTQNQMLKSLLAVVAKTVKDFVECPKCGGAGFTEATIKDVYVNNVGEKLVIKVETGACDCKKQAKGVLAIIRKYEGNETKEVPSGDTA